MTTKPWRTWRGCQRRQRWRPIPKSRFPTWRQYHEHRRKFLKPLLDALEAMTAPLPGLRPIVDEAVKNIAAMQAARIARAKRTARLDVPETDFGIMGVGE